MLLDLRVDADAVVVHLADGGLDFPAAQEVEGIPIRRREFHFHAYAVQPFVTVEQEGHLGDRIVAGHHMDHLRAFGRDTVQDCRWIRVLLQLLPEVVASVADDMDLILFRRKHQHDGIHPRLVPDDVFQVVLHDPCRVRRVAEEGGRGGGGQEFAHGLLYINGV